jgi:hypothetical protein
MGISHADFFRTLEVLLEGKSHTVSGTWIDIPGEGQRVTISLSQQRERRLGPLIKLPVTDVEIAFSGYPEAQRRAFMERFEIIFHRGGG